ncbi:GNAT family N-acetyltransferase [Thiomonas intermedia]|uniref:GNAT family N-acetyltransferase n=1 Tax=Thiomonas intermedia TaxID=926 RepID=UPI0009A4CE07|nr:GNAT family N-acetyltransferase [Thiomonas intermedia]
MTAAPSSYAALPADLQSDRATIVSLWVSNLGHPGRREDKYDWFYLRNPAGPPQVLLARTPAEDGVAIGVIGLGTRQMRLAGQPVAAGLLADFGVVAEHRTLYPAMLLQTTLRDRFLPQLGLIYGFPNPKSEPVVKRLGYRVAGSMVRHVRVLRSANYLPTQIPHPIRRILGHAADWWRHALRRTRYAHDFRGYLAQWLDQPDARFDALWSAQNDPALLIGVRDRRYLAWRFEQKPWRKFRFLALSARSEGLVAYAVCEVVGKVLHVRDLLCHPDHPNSLDLLFDRLFRDAYADGRTSVSFEFLGPVDMVEALQRLGMVARDARNVMCTMPEASAETLRQAQWYLTSADEDY